MLHRRKGVTKSWPAPGSFRDSSRLAYARLLAAGPLEGLLENHVWFISVVQLEGPDEVLWDGVERLAIAVLRGKASNPRRLAKRILDTTSLYREPTFLTPIVDELAKKLPELRDNKR